MQIVKFIIQHAQVLYLQAAVYGVSSRPCQHSNCDYVQTYVFSNKVHLDTIRMTSYTTHLSQCDKQNASVTERTDK